MFPLRVLIESVPAGECLECRRAGTTLADSYAIVSGQTPLSQLVDTVLGALQLPHLAPNAKGLIQINNWKPLTFDQITDDADITVEALLKDVAAHTTLKILTRQSSDATVQDCLNDMKERLLQATMKRVPHILATIKNHQLQDFVAALLQGAGNQLTVSADLMQGFNHWLDELSEGATLQLAVSRNGDDVTSTQKSPPQSQQQQPATTTRLNPQLELPRLERWFADQPNPSRHKLLQYVQILNASNFRRRHNKVTYQQLCNWFSMARAAGRHAANDASNNRPRRLPITSPPPPPKTDDVAAQTLTTIASQSSSVSKLFNGDIRQSTFDFNELLRRRQEEFEKEQQQEQQQVQDQDAEQGMSVSPIEPQHSSSSPSVSPSAADGSFIQVTTKQEIKGEFETATTENEESPMGGVEEQQQQVGRPVTAPGACRSRLMFDPLSELPLLERWFEENPHPSWIQIDQFTESLNSLPYRQTYPPISTHNVKIWFKNRRAKTKRLMGNSMVAQPLAAGSLLG